MTKRYIVIPDSQVKPDEDVSFLNWISQYIVDCKPDVVVHLGDFWDMPSLSSYDKGKRQFEGRRYAKDIDAGSHAWDVLNQPIRDEIVRLRVNKKKRWEPDRYFLIGNHEQRIQRAVDKQAELEGIIGYQDLAVYNDFDWFVQPFLEPLILDGIAFNHYFTTGLAGRPASTANAQLNKQHMSCIAGHQQGLQIATAHRADGKRMTSIISGSCYVHDEEYLGPQGNNHWRGVLRLEEVKDGQFDLLPISLNYLKKKYA